MYILWYSEEKLVWGLIDLNRLLSWPCEVRLIKKGLNCSRDHLDLTQNKIWHFKWCTCIKMPKMIQIFFPAWHLATWRGHEPLYLGHIFHHFSLSSTNSSFYTKVLDISTKGSCLLFAWLFQSKKIWMDLIFDPLLEEVINFSTQVDLGALWNHCSFWNKWLITNKGEKIYCLTCVHDFVIHC